MTSEKVFERLAIIYLRLFFFFLMIQGVRAEESSPLAQIAEGLKTSKLKSMDGPFMPRQM
ncbi:hypothetical protein BsIDN1_64710 [Bacillus safensis]|uniref:Uncharacterized protein n=1 Tax=Bacillus safensis TaxID=561879 RepID=A0A5S9MIC3_BACIA|nr:hypothetical protein BsIDN1_64710 [Bacillus safensis]